MMRLALAVTLSLALAACAKEPTYKFDLGQEAELMPETVREKCDLIPVELTGDAALANITLAYSNLIGLYGVCATRDHAKAKWISSQDQ